MNDLNIEQLQQRIRDLEERNAQLQKENDEMSFNHEYGCFTRQGFQKKIWPMIAAEARWAIYFDIDDMRGLNNAYSHAVVNQMIKQVLRTRASDYKAGQRYSGDEFFIFITDDPKHNESDPVDFCMRLAHEMRQIGFTATFAIAPVRSDVLEENVEPAVRLVEEAKALGKRGTISIVPGDPR